MTHTELTKETREIVRITHADGSNCRYIGDTHGTMRIIAYDEKGNGDWEPWIRCLDFNDATIMRAPARHFILEFEAKDYAREIRFKEMPF